LECDLGSRATLTVHVPTCVLIFIWNLADLKCSFKKAVCIKQSGAKIKVDPEVIVSPSSTMQIKVSVTISDTRMSVP